MNTGHAQGISPYEGGVHCLVLTIPLPVRASTPLSLPTPRDRHLYESCPATRQRLLVPRVDARAHWHRRETCGLIFVASTPFRTLANRQTTVPYLE
jgi:hypothetical protein